MIVIYEKENCVQCRSTRIAFDKRQIPYESRHIEEDDSWKQYMPEAKMAPVVVDTLTGEAWSGFRFEKIRSYK